MNNNYRFGFFPYLKTSDRFYYRGLTLRDIAEVEDVPEDVISHIAILRNLFFLRDGQQIKRMSYTFWDISEPNDEDRVDENHQKLMELSTIFAYGYSSPHQIFGDTFLTKEHANYFVFTPSMVTKYLLYNDYNVEISPNHKTILENDEIRDIVGYEVLLNNKDMFWISEGFRIYPPSSNFWLNIHQDIYADYSRSAIQNNYISVYDHFCSKEVRNEDDWKVLTSLKWYNYSVSLNIPGELAVVFLAVAFESLLGLKQREKLTERFKESVTLLLGNIPRLDSWLTQFYDARSQILHEGWSSNLMFLAQDVPKLKRKKTVTEYRSLVSYGRHIFRVCVAAILTGSQLANELGIPSMLITNQERFEEICKLLDQEEVHSYEKIIGIRQVVWEINEYQFVKESRLNIDTLLGAARRIINEYLQLEPDEAPEVINLMEEFSNLPPDNEHFNALSLIKDILGHIGQLPEVNPSKSSEAGIVVSTLLDCIWQYSFMYYFQMERQQRE